MEDVGKVGKLAAELMQAVEEEYPDGRVGVVGLVIEVVLDDEQATVLRYRATDPRVWVQAGLFRRVALALEHVRD